MGWQERIKPLETEADKLRDAIKLRKLKLVEMESGVTGAIAEVEKHRETLSVVQAQTLTAQGNVAIYEAKLVGIQAQISEISQQLAPLHAEQIELTEKISGARKALQLLENESASALSQYEADKIERERTLNNLMSRAEEISIKIQEDEKSWERSRQDLAVRETKLNEREKAIETRELKIARDERNLARNHELLSM